jgi:hypothetical protein
MVTCRVNECYSVLRGVDVCYGALHRGGLYYGATALQSTM